MTSQHLWLYFLHQTSILKNNVGFYFCPYDRFVGGSYAKAAFSSIGVRSGQLVNNVVARLGGDFKSIKLVP